MVSRLIGRYLDCGYDCCPYAAEVCGQKAEVDEGAQTLSTDFFNDLECSR